MYKLNYTNKKTQKHESKKLPFSKYKTLSNYVAKLRNNGIIDTSKCVYGEPIGLLYGRLAK